MKKFYDREKEMGILTDVQRHTYRKNEIIVAGLSMDNMGDMW